MTEANKLYAIYALADMVLQFGYTTKFRNQDALCDGGLSALESAFWALELCGCPINSNGSITVKKLWAFAEEVNEKAYRKSVENDN